MIYFSRKFAGLLLFTFFCAGIPAQTHTTVPLEHEVYSILEEAEARGLCAPLPPMRPWTRGIAASALEEALASGKRVTDTERAILERCLARLSPPAKTGFDLQRGAYYKQAEIAGTGAAMSLDAGAGLDGQMSAGFYAPQDERFFGGELWMRMFARGDIGAHVSYGFYGEIGLVQTPREYLGTYNTYYEGFVDDPEKQYVNRKIDVYSEPLTHFPYTYKKRWDSSVYFFDNMSSFESWPGTLAGTYSLRQELNASFFNNRLMLRAGRVSREWGGAPQGSSLTLNRMARPFLAFDLYFAPFSWINISALTGSLEYYNTEGIKISSAHFQNMFSSGMIQIHYKNFIYLDVGEGVIWPKRLEFGYMLPIISKFFFQNNIGDFDNLSMSVNIKAQYPGAGGIWASFFLDEANFFTDIFVLDRSMWAAQAGIFITPGFLPAFSRLTVSYTVVNPYCYTHNRNKNPWYSEPMETAYINNGVSLGYYLSPNSDEVLVRFTTMPARSLSARLQCQLIRHGADFGPSAVDGSNLLSELDPDGRDTNPVLKRFFLRDGAYQWFTIIKAGLEWKVPGAPLVLYGEGGVVFSWFTNIEGKANGGEPEPYSVIDTAEYPRSTNILFTLGFKIFPQ